MCGGASTQNYSIECSFVVKKFNIIKDGKPEEEKSKIISKEYKTLKIIWKNSEDYLELKDAKKIQVLNSECLKYK